MFLKRTPGISDRQVGQLISRYRLLRKLGEGGMGDVYLAEDTVLGRPVALKFLSGSLLRDSERRTRLFREARAAALIDHPNVCTVHEIDEIDGHPFLVMAYIEGQNLEDRIADGALEVGRRFEYRLPTCGRVASGPPAGCCASRPETGQHHH